MGPNTYCLPVLPGRLTIQKLRELRKRRPDVYRPAGEVTVSVKGLAYDDVYREDSIRVEVPAVDKPTPLRLSIDTNPVSARHTLTPKVYCLYSDGSLRDITDRVA